MIRNLLNRVSQRVSTKFKQNANNQSFSSPLQIESLEDRIMLSWVGFFDGVTLDLVQTADDGDVVIDNSGVGGAFRTIDNADTLTFVDAENVTVTMLDGTANQLNFNINTTHTGDVEINLGDGPRDVAFSGTIFPGIANRIGGDLTVNGGSGPQFINLAPITFIPIPFETGGNATFDLGDGFDTVYNNENFVIIGGDLNLRGVNLFRYTDFLFPVPLDADLKVGGNFTMDTSNESVESFLIEGGTFHDPDPDVNERSIIFGDFIFIGGDDIDHVNLNDTYIVGDVIIDLGEGIPFFGDPQNVTTTLTLPIPFGGPAAQIDGNISISAGDANLGNIITLDGHFNGDTVDFFLSDKVDTVTYTLLGTQADVTAFMGKGDDTFTLDVGVNVLDIDFGNDVGDMFINNFGKFNFDSDITNFHFFDHLYTVGDDTLELFQLIDTGDIKIDNDGGPGAFGIDWRVFTSLGGVGSTTTASTLILNMLDNTNNDVEMDLVNPVLAFLTLNLGDGDRDVNFTGASNNPLRDINITANEGIQNIEISVNAPLAVATLNIDLGSGFDTVDDDANNLLIGEDLIFSGVNLFENDGVLSVTRNAFIASDTVTEDTIFANNSQMFVGGFFRFNGGNGRDEVRLNGVTSNSFSGTVTIDLGENLTGGTQMALLDGAGTSIAGTLAVDSNAGGNPDIFALSATANLNSNVIVDLGDGQNDATILGNFGGSFIQYSGGTGVDNVVFGTTGSPAELIVDLGSGDDSFTLLAGSSLSDDLVIDFGTGDDTFTNLYGLFDFSAALLNLDGFNHIYDFPTDTLTSTQISDFGPIVVDNNGASNAFRFMDGGTNIITAATHLNIAMLDDSGTDLTVRLDNALAGSLAIDLGDGNRNLNLDGTNNSVGGNLFVTADDDDQTVEVAVNNALTVGGNAVFSFGGGDDRLDEDGNDVSITGDLTFIGVNKFENNGTMNVGGDFSINNSSQIDRSWLDDDSTMTIGGNFSYTGGVARDEVKLNGLVGGTNIGGAVSIDVGDNLAGGPQSIWFNSMSSVGGSMMAVSTNGNSTDSFSSEAGTTFGGDINIDFGSGPNDAVILGAFGGTNIDYKGGASADNVRLGTTGSDAEIDIRLGAGNDVFTLDAGTAVSPTLLRVDFGGGDDDFVNNYGLFDFNANLVKWDGYTRFYDHAESSLIINQVSNTGNITIDNNGVGGTIRLLNGSTTEMTPADNIRVNMLANSGNAVSIDYDLPQAGNTVLDLKGGDRVVRFIGDSNEIGGLLRIDAGTNGAQTVQLAVTTDLDVAESVVINLRGGNDVVDEGSNNLNIGTNFILRAVNVFRADQTIDVGGNFTMNTSFDNQTSVLDNNGTMNIGGNLNYFGGTSSDNVFMNSANIFGNVNVELGTGTNSQTADFSGASAARLRIAAGSSAGNFVLTDAGTTISGDVIMRFDGTSSVNNVTLLGTYDGGYGTFRGSGGVDNVTFGAIATNMNFVARLAGGNDKFTLKANTDLGSSLLDFGNGNDVFDDEIGAPHPFPLKIINLV